MPEFQADNGYPELTLRSASVEGVKHHGKKHERHHDRLIVEFREKGFCILEVLVNVVLQRPCDEVRHLAEDCRVEEQGKDDEKGDQVVPILNQRGERS
jgi:hypothetical protein